MFFSCFFLPPRGLPASRREREERERREFVRYYLVSSFVCWLVRTCLAPRRREREKSAAENRREGARECVRGEPPVAGALQDRAQP